MGISAWQIGIILLIVILLFGTKKLRNIGGDLGEAVKGFKNGIKDKEDPELTSIEQNKVKDSSSVRHEALDTDADFADKSTVAK